MPYVYKLTHKLTGQFYIGYREANKIPSDQDLLVYKSSAPKIKESFQDYHCEIVAEFFSGQDAYQFENYLISAHFEDPLILNRFYVKNGHRNFRCPSHTTETKLKIATTMRGKQRSAVSSETKAKISSSLLGRKATLEQRAARSEFQTGKLRGAYTSWKVVSPSGEEFLTKDLQAFSKEHLLSYNTLRTTSSRGIPTRGRTKGWSATII